MPKTTFTCYHGENQPPTFKEIFYGDFPCKNCSNTITLYMCDDHKKEPELCESCLDNMFTIIKNTNTLPIELKKIMMEYAVDFDELIWI